MKKLLLAALALYLLCNAAQAGFMQDISGILHALTDADELPDTISYEGISYRTGFYGKNYGIKPELQGETILVDGKEYSIADHEHFSMLINGHGVSSGILNGILYCAENQWDDAQAYYADDANYNYYCQIGVQYVDRDPEYRLLDMDAQMFHRLMDFADENAYNPFGRKQHDALVRLPIPHRDDAPKLIFYRESKDGCLVSYRGHSFHIVDSRLLLVHFYDYGHGEYEEMAAVEVPAELGNYFINLLKNG